MSASLAPEQAVWFALMALALEFVAVGAVFRGEPTFRWLGWALLALCAMVGCDVWVTLPGPARGLPKPLLDAFQLAFQACACVFLALLLGLVRHLAGIPSRTAFRIHAAVLGAWILLASADALHPADLFTGFRDGAWHTSAVYDFGFTPYVVGLMGWITWTAFAARRRLPASAARVLDRLGIGFAFLLFFGCLDLATLHVPGRLPPASYSSLGMLGFGMVGTFLLTDHLVRLYGERRRYLLEAARVQGELGADAPLRAIGRSAAEASEAIRAEVSDLRDRVESLREGTSGGHGAEIARIERARRRLERLATGILEFSRSGIPGSKALHPPLAFVERWARALPPGEAERVRVTGAPDLDETPLDPARLERVLRELVRNALDAGARAVEIRVLQGLGRTVFAVEDDGLGFAGSLADIPKPFFTTRKAEGGAGLGAALAAGLMRGLGGSLRWYRARSGGLLAILALPMEGAPAEAAACALAGGDAARMEDFLAACENLGVRPSLVGSPGAARGPGEALLIDARGGAAEPLSEETVLRALAGATPRG